MRQLIQAQSKLSYFLAVDDGGQPYLSYLALRAVSKLTTTRGGNRHKRRVGLRPLILLLLPTLWILRTAPWLLVPEH